jgi:hypothetical protein
VAALIDFPGLSEAQRNVVRHVVEDAARWIKRGNGWDTTEPVTAVNQLCGADLTPVTMIP